MAAKVDREETRTFYCRLEVQDGRKDYLRGGRCVRLAGVDKSSWAPDSLELDAVAYVLDVDVWEWYRARAAYWPGYERLPSEETNAWVKVDLRVGHGRSYFYPAFAKPSVNPVRFEPADISIVQRGPALPKFPRVRNLGLVRAPSLSEFDLSAFHVGQGMASLVSDLNHGVLIDAGAGGPVTRHTYPSLKRNELKDGVLKLKTLDFVLSHADADHWRILQWDSAIRSKVRTFCAPTGVSSVLFNDPAVRKKIRWLSHAKLDLGIRSSLELFRTSPALSDRNGEALIACFRKASNVALLPGDYVYQGIIGDGNPQVRALGAQLYAAVVVPHHGDDASSVSVFRAAANGKAFFSAGTHAGYKHPRPAAIAAHATAGYKNIVDNAQAEIVAVPLL